MPTRITLRDLYAQARALKSGILLESSYGITHVEDLPIETFMRLLKKLHTLHCVQKLDGSNLLLGVDIDGRMYTSREQKGGKRFYEVEDFPKTSAFDWCKTAHAALMKVKDKILELVKPGNCLNCEVLYGSQPNTVIYGKDNLSYVAFLEATEGDDPTMKLDRDLPKKLHKALKKQRVSVETTVGDTTDGTSIVRAPKLSDWGFTSSDVVDEDLKNVDIAKNIDELEKFLDKSCGSLEAKGVEMTNYDVLKAKDGKYAEIRKSLEEEVMEKFKLPIKNILLDLVEKQQPSLRSATAKSEGGYNGIEGLIFTDFESGEQFKVVNREEFTAANKFNYEVRNKIVGQVLTADEGKNIEAQGGLVGQAKSRCLRLFNIPGLELPSQAAKALQTFMGGDAQETLQNIEDSVSKLSFESIKRKMGAILTHVQVDLDDELDKFKSKDSKELKLGNGQSIKYTPEVKRRTLLTFAESKAALLLLLKEIRKARDFGELLNVFFKETIKELHANEEDGELDPEEAEVESPAPKKKKLKPVEEVPEEDFEMDVPKVAKE